MTLNQIGLKNNKQNYEHDDHSYSIVRRHLAFLRVWKIFDEIKMNISTFVLCKWDVMAMTELLFHVIQNAVMV